jgi:hypothetical protein
MRKNLVVVRGGDRSLHPLWLTGGERGFDLLLSYYGDAELPARGAYDLLHRCKGSKWQGLADLLATRGPEIARYERVWFPDDDLFTDARTIDALFAAAERFGLDLCQPALEAYSFVTHPITLQRSDCLCRITDFVEVMAPLFSARALAVLGPTFGENASGWGLEWLWKRLCRDHGFVQGIIDQHPVFHSRAVGSAGHGGADSPRAEMDRLIAKHGLQRSRPRVLRRIPSGRSRIAGLLRARLVRTLLRSRPP